LLPASDDIRDDKVPPEISGTADIAAPVPMVLIKVLLDCI
jgi:hypothetical protein